MDFTTNIVMLRVVNPQITDSVKNMDAFSPGKERAKILNTSRYLQHMANNITDSAGVAKVEKDANAILQRTYRSS